MRREVVSEGQKVLGTVFSRALTAFRVLTDHCPAWAQRPIWGERLGVWLFGVLWVAVPTAVAFFLFY